MSSETCRADLKRLINEKVVASRRLLASLYCLLLCVCVCVLVFVCLFVERCNETLSLPVCQLSTFEDPVYTLLLPAISVTVFSPRKKL